MIEPKEKFLKNLGIKTQAIYAGKLSSDIAKKTEVRHDESNEQDPISWTGLMELDMIIYPTIKGTLDLDQKGSVYVLLGSLTLPNGTINIKNEFEFVVRLNFFTLILNSYIYLLFYF